MSETVDWLSAGDPVQLICEASAWLDPLVDRSRIRKRAHFRRRSFAANSGSMEVRVIAILVANVPEGCPNLLPDMRYAASASGGPWCAAFIRRRSIRSSSWKVGEQGLSARRRGAVNSPLLQRDGRVVSDVIRQDIQRSRDTDVLEVSVKRRLCAALQVADAAVTRARAFSCIRRRCRLCATPSPLL